MTDVNGNDMAKETLSEVSSEVKEGAVTDTAEAPAEVTVAPAETAAEATAETTGEAASEDAVTETEATAAADATATETAAATEAPAPGDKPEKKKKKRQKNSFVYSREVVVSDRWNNIILIALILLVIVGVIIHFLPENRVKRLLKKGDEAYSLEQYEDACEYYSKAVYADLSNPISAHSLIVADIAAGNGEAAQDLYKICENLDEYKARRGSFNITDEDRPGWTELFLLSPEIFNGKEDAEMLKRGYDMLGEPSELKPALANAYYEWGDEVTADNYAEALDCFDLSLLYSDNAESYRTEVKEQVNAVIKTLEKTGEYDKAYEVLNRYEKLLDNPSGMKADLNRSEELYNIKVELLSQVYDTFKPYYDSVKDKPLKERVKDDTPVFGMMAENWEKMLMLDGSESADELAFSFASDSYFYAPEGFTDNFTGVGCGVYTYGDKYTLSDGSEGTAYYFYFGDYVDGKRNGFGMIFIKVDVSSYMAFEGEWKDDCPNGFGASYECDMYSYTSLAEYRRATFGNYNDGLENGDMVSIVLLNEHPDTYFKGSYKAALGVADSVEGELINYGIVDPVPEGRKLIAVLASDEAGYTYVVPVYVPTDDLLGVVGW